MTANLQILLNKFPLRHLVFKVVLIHIGNVAHLRPRRIKGAAIRSFIEIQADAVGICSRS